MKKSRERKKPSPPPEAKVWNRGDDVIVRCPCCQSATSIDNYDIIGADDDCIFCNSCWREVRLPDSRKTPQDHPLLFTEDV